MLYYISRLYKDGEPEIVKLCSGYQDQVNKMFALIHFFQILLHFQTRLICLFQFLRWFISEALWKLNQFLRRDNVMIVNAIKVMLGFYETKKVQTKGEFDLCMES